MRFVNPIKDQREIYSLLHFLKNWNRNYYVAAALGINWGLRCSDILSVRIGDVIAGSGSRIQIRNEIRLVEIKNHHERLIPVSDEMKGILHEHISWLGYPNVPADTPLVVSRNYRYLNTEVEPKSTARRRGEIELKALSRKRLWTVISYAAHELDIKDKLGTHSLRKTYVYQAWSKGETLDIIRKELGHGSIEYTERYAAIPLSMTRAIYEKTKYALPPTSKPKRKKRPFGAFSKKIKKIVDNWVSDHDAFLRSWTYSAFKRPIPTRHNTRYVPFVMGVGAG